MSKDNYDLFLSYTNEWHKKFIEEKNKILNKLAEDGLRIEHIGSTSVKGMEARPIIDIMIGLDSFDRSIKMVRKVLKDNHYNEAISLLDLGERYFFIKKGNEDQRTFTALVIRVNGRLWRRNLEKKRLLAASEETRKDYINFKKKSWERSSGDLEKYSHYKEKYFSKINQLNRGK